MNVSMFMRRKAKVIGALLALLTLAMISAACTVQPIVEQQPAATAQNKALVEEVVQRVFNEGNVDAIDELLAADFIEHEEGAPGQDAGREGLKEAMVMMRTAFPDLTVTIEDMVAEGDKVVVRGTWSGTHEGDFMGAPPTGNSFTMNVIDVFRIEDGQIAEHWGVSDIMAMVTQLALLPAPEMGDAPQAESYQTETYTDENGLFTAEYPTGWVVDPYGFGDEDPTPHVNFGSDREILDLSMMSEPLPEGQIGASVILLHRDMLAEEGLTTEASLEEMAQKVIASMAPEEVQPEMAEASYESITLENGTPAVRITMAGPTEAYVVHLADMGDGVLLLAPQIMALDYENDELEAQVEAIVNSVVVNASGEEVMAFIMENMGATSE